MHEPSTLPGCQPDSRKELHQLIDCLASHNAPVFPARMENHFRIAKEKPYSFRNSVSALGVSIGGTQTKVMVGSFVDSRLEVRYLRTFRNPAVPAQYTDFFDSILIEDPELDGILKSGAIRACGFAFPMSIQDGKPFHATKLPTICGLICRVPGDPAIRSFDLVFKDYCNSRGLPSMTLVYQGDGIVAHHGAISLTDMKVEETSTLLICGTGLATGDESNYVQIGLVKAIGEDKTLYPDDETEDGQIQYALAGKGLYSLMRRLVRSESERGGSPLAGWDPAIHFSSAEDSRLVALLWNGDETMEEVHKAMLMRELNLDNEIGLEKIPPSIPDLDIPEKYSSGSIQSASEQALTIGEQRFLILRELAGKIMRRVPVSLANCVIATIVNCGTDLIDRTMITDKNAALPSRMHRLFLEGSIAKNPHVARGIKRALQEYGWMTFMDSGSTLFEHETDKNLENCFPCPLCFDPPLIPLKYAEKGEGSRTEEADITAIGAISSGIAEYIISRSPAQTRPEPGQHSRAR